MAETRRADATWEGDLLSGKGTVGASTSQRFSSLPVSWASRTGSANGLTSPEELLAAAHASCYAMQLSHELASAGTPAERLNVGATVTFDRVGEGWGVTSSALTVRGRVPGATADAFRQTAESAKNNCPISRTLQGNVQLSVEATLE